jgi:hypothetical protein
MKMTHKKCNGLMISFDLDHSFNSIYSLMARMLDNMFSRILTNGHLSEEFKIQSSVSKAQAYGKKRRFYFLFILVRTTTKSIQFMNKPVFLFWFFPCCCFAFISKAATTKNRQFIYDLSMLWWGLFCQTTMFSCIKYQTWHLALPTLQILSSHTLMILLVIWRKFRLVSFKIRRWVWQ